MDLEVGEYARFLSQIVQYYYLTEIIVHIPQNKADFLAEGIYVALVTTLGGLSVAIPAAILAHYFEGRIQSIFHRIDEMLFNLLPQVERFEGRMRVTHRRLKGDEPSQLVTPTQSPTSD